MCSDLALCVGEYPTDIAKTHIIFQLLSICEDKVKLKRELVRLRREKKDASTVVSFSKEMARSESGETDNVSSRALSRSFSPQRTSSADRLDTGQSKRSITAGSVSFDLPPNGETESASSIGGEEASASEYGDAIIEEKEEEESELGSARFEEEMLQKYRRHSLSVGYFIEPPKPAKKH